MPFSSPTIGGLSVATKSEIIKWFLVDTGVVGWELVVTDTGGNAIWFHGPMDSTAMIAEINAVGSILAWLKSFLPAINAAVLSHFKPAAPPPTAAITIDNINLTIAGGFVWTPGTDAPVLTAK